MARRILTIEKARRLFSHLIQDYRDGVIEERKARTLAYLLSTYISICRDTELERRIEALETMVASKNKSGFWG